MRTFSREHLNVIRYLFRKPVLIPVVLFRALSFALIRVNRIISAFFRITRGKSARKKVPGRKLDLTAMPYMQVSSSEVTRPVKIKLACETITVESAIDWGYTYRDIEDTFALNRFGWLLAELIEAPSVPLAKKALLWIDDWIGVMAERKDHFAWESYSVSERLANWPFILLILKQLIPLPEKFMKDIEMALIDHLDYLFCHLELSEKTTNNHILNNARGLYIGGILLNDIGATEKARKLFLEWTPKMFSKDGVLRERSSHYHFLLCQRYEQITLLAKNAGDKTFQVFMEKWHALMHEACVFLLVSSNDNRSTIPLFGDISPDFPPKWFLPGGGWATLKLWLGEKEENRKFMNTENVCIQRKGDFIRADTRNISCFWHAPVNTEPFLRHGHYDLGGFVLFYHGQEIFTDPGRYSYTNDGLYGIGAKAHSTVIIEALGPFCEDHRLNRLMAYENLRLSYDMSYTDEQFTLIIETSGFERLYHQVRWKRKFIFLKRSLTIEDILESRGKNVVETRFQIAPGIRIQQNDGRFHLVTGPNAQLSFEADNRHECSFCLPELIDEGAEGWASKEYGVRERGKTFSFRRNINCSESHTYHIRWT